MVSDNDHNRNLIEMWVQNTDLKRIYCGVYDGQKIPGKEQLCGFVEFHEEQDYEIVKRLLHSMKGKKIIMPSYVCLESGERFNNLKRVQGLPRSTK